MKKHFKIFYSLLIIVVILTSCSQVSKNIANDKLSGNYNGEMIFIFKYSLLNATLNDSKVPHKCFAIVFANENQPSIDFTLYDTIDKPLSTEHVNIIGVNLLSNGARFNIPKQEHKVQNDSFPIEGIPLFDDSEGNKFTGMVDDKNNLSFSYSGIIPMLENGIKYNLPFEAHFTLNKK